MTDQDQLEKAAPVLQEVATLKQLLAQKDEEVDRWKAEGAFLPPLTHLLFAVGLFSVYLMSKLCAVMRVSLYVSKYLWFNGVIVSFEMQVLYPSQI